MLRSYTRNTSCLNWAYHFFYGFDVFDENKSLLRELTNGTLAYIKVGDSFIQGTIKIDGFSHLFVGEGISFKIKNSMIPGSYSLNQYI